MNKILFTFFIAMTATLPGVTSTGCNMQGCTELGCSDQVTVQVTGAFDTFINNFPAKAHVCVGVKCVDAVLDVDAAGKARCAASGFDCTIDGQGVVSLSLVDTGKGGVQTTIEIVGKDGVAKFTAEEATKLQEFFPNGEDCGGACYQGTMAFTAKVN